MIGDPEFDRAFRIAWKLDTAIHGGSSSGAGAFVPFVRADYPILYATERRRGTPATLRKQYPPVDVKEQYHLLDSMQYWAERFERVYDVEGNEWPIDFGLIFSGDVKYTEEVTDGMVIDREERIGDGVEALDTLRHWCEFFPTGVPAFVADFAQSKTDTSSHAYDSLWDQMNGFGMLLVMQVAWNLHRAFKLHSTGSVQRLIDSINEFQKYLGVIGVSSFSIDVLSSEFQKFVRERDARGTAAVKISGAGKSGELVFMVPKRQLHGAMDDLVAHLTREASQSRRVSIDYLSWEDVIGAEGVRIEQDFGTDTFSEWVRDDSLAQVLCNQRSNHRKRPEIRTFIIDRQPLCSGRISAQLRRNPPCVKSPLNRAIRSMRSWYFWASTPSISGSFRS